MICHVSTPTKEETVKRTNVYEMRVDYADGYEVLEVSHLSLAEAVQFVKNADPTVERVTCLCIIDRNPQTPLAFL